MGKVIERICEVLGNENEYYQYIIYQYYMKKLTNKSNLFMNCDIIIQKSLSSRTTSRIIP